MGSQCLALQGVPIGAALGSELVLNAGSRSVNHDHHFGLASQGQHSAEAGLSTARSQQGLETECETSYSWRLRIELELFHALYARKQKRKNGSCRAQKVSDGGDGNLVRNRIISLVRTLGLAFAFGGIASLMKILLSALPPDFLDRWRRLEGEQPNIVPKSPPEAQLETVIYDCHGAVIATIVPGGYIGKRDPMKTANAAPLRPPDIPSAMWQAVVASEDRRFFEHHGIDPRGISRAVLSLAASGGGSTITQQLVKNMFLTNERKLARKVVEIILALLLEKRMSKWDILHLYLNKIYWGHGVYGIEAASAFYFGKHPSLLTLAECAMLAGIIPAPELLSPYRDPSRGKKPQARTLRRMVEAGFLDAETAAAAVDEPLGLAIEVQEGTSGPWRAPYFVSEVLYELTQTYGRDKILRGGLQVYTTLDLTMQEIAEKAVRDAVIEYDDERVILADKGIEKTREKIQNLQKTRDDQIQKAVTAAVNRALKDAKKHHAKAEHDPKLREEMENAVLSLAAEKAKATLVAREKSLNASLAAYEEETKKAAETKMEAAMVAIDPMDGAVRVLVGGRDYYESSFNRCTQAFRPPGSTFKPVVYLTALAEGIDRNHLLMDEPYTVGGFTPENYDRKFRGQVTVEESLLKSLNVPTVKLCAEVGIDKVCSMGAALGIDTFLPYELSLSLGGCEVTPLQLATVYSTIASGGMYRKPYFISRVEDPQGQVLQEQPAPSQDLVVDEYAVSELRMLLQAVVERGTGRGARMGRPCAGKTGTSDGHRDAWFAGFTPELSCVVWLGYDDNTTVGGMHPATGSSHAAPLWRHFMSLVHEGAPIGRFHDIGRDRYGGRGPRQFEKRSRRRQRNGVREVRMDFANASESSTRWQEVWDWEKASVAWEEREKMQEWTATRFRRKGEVKSQWQNYSSRSDKGVYSSFTQLANSCLRRFSFQGTASRPAASETSNQPVL